MPSFCDSSEFSISEIDIGVEPIGIHRPICGCNVSRMEGRCPGVRELFG